MLYVYIEQQKAIHFGTRIKQDMCTPHAKAHTGMHNRFHVQRMINPLRLSGIRCLYQFETLYSGYTLLRHDIKLH
jgi:hypothetical protein